MLTLQNLNDQLHIPGDLFNLVKVGHCDNRYVLVAEEEERKSVKETHQELLSRIERRRSTLTIAYLSI